nr:hypothetical protein BaRGS_013093 [Batillaria attramentaria]
MGVSSDDACSFRPQVIVAMNNIVQVTWPFLVVAVGVRGAIEDTQTCIPETQMLALREALERMRPAADTFQDKTGASQRTANVTDIAILHSAHH